jgi:tRNA (cmo5U34)-methyltransferase
MGAAKSTVDEIRARFDADVERFSNLETGQLATMDAPLALDRIAHAAIAATPQAQRLLDIGCGAGNFTLRVLQLRRLSEVTLIDLSQPMLERAQQRIRQVHAGSIHAVQGDLRDVPVPTDHFDIVLAGAVLHHLRTEAEWEATFEKLYRSLAPGGSLWIFDMVVHPHAAVQVLMWRHYGEYLTALQDSAYRDRVFAYIDKEDTPKPLVEQLNLLQRVGFSQVDVLHYHTCFAAFGGIKPHPSAAYDS